MAKPWTRRRFKKALDACKKSGGTVKFPPGTYLSQPLTIRTKCKVDVGDDNVAIEAGKKVAGREFDTKWKA